MELITDELRERIPPLYATEKIDDPEVVCHLFDPCSGANWYVIEMDKEDGDTLFGLAEIFESELGYFALSELQAYRGPYGLGIERDLFFTPRPLSQIKRMERA